MGRKPLYFIRVHVALSNEQLDHIERRRGPGRRAAYVREAVDKLIELDKAEEASHPARLQKMHT